MVRKEQFHCYMSVATHLRTKHHVHVHDRIRPRHHVHLKSGRPTTPSKEEAGVLLLGRTLNPKP